MSQPTSPDLAATLLAHRSAFKAFLISRVGNDADAEDVLQHGLIKALQNSSELRDGEKSIAWFYRILRRTIIDHARQRNAARLRDNAWATDDALTPSTDDERSLCRCFAPLIAELRPKHSDLLRLVELDGRSVSAAAIALGITANSASVTLHRARAELRAKLEAVCGACADRACLDCDCADGP
jgi:RNA polymerase sigma-70 factor (ECF subfamily)